MLKINRVHHIAIICSDYQLSKHFYTQILGFKIIKEHYRAERKSYKLDLQVGNQYQIELFSFPDPAKRPTHPEATGLRHLAFEVDNIYEAVNHITDLGVVAETVRKDELTGKLFTFFTDPDGLPLEFYEK